MNSPPGSTRRGDVRHQRLPGGAVVGRGVRAVGADHRRVARSSAHRTARVDLQQPRDLRAGQLLAPRRPPPRSGPRRPSHSQRVADERAPVVGGGVARRASARSPRGSPAGSRRGGSPRPWARRGTRGAASARCRRPGPAHRPGRRLHRVGEERDRLALVGLDDAVVVGQVVARHPVGVERRAPRAPQERARQASEDVLVAGGAEVRAREEEQRVVGGDRVGQHRGAERAGVVGRLLGQLGGDVARARGDPLRRARPAAG